MADFFTNQQDPDAIRKAMLARIFGQQPGVRPTQTPGQPPQSGQAPAAPAEAPASAPQIATPAKPIATPTTASEPSSQPPPAASPLSEEEYAKQHPLAPHTPYVVPDLKHRVLMGLFAGMQQFGRDPGAGDRMLGSYLGDISKQEEAEKNYPQTAADQLKKNYQNYIASQKGPLDIQDLQEQINLRQKQAAETQERTTQLKNKGVPWKLTRGQGGEPIEMVDPQGHTRFGNEPNLEPEGRQLWDNAMKAYKDSQKGAKLGPLNPIVEMQMGGPPPSPENYTGGENDTKFKADLLDYGQKAEKIANRMAGASAAERGKSFGEWKPVQEIDPKTGNAKWTWAKMAIDEGGAPAQIGASAMKQHAFISDIRQSINRVKGELGVFDEGMYDRIKLAAGLADPQTTKVAYLQGIARERLSKEQQQLVADLFNMREQAMTMRSVLGAGQGSDDLRAAIMQALPWIATPNSEFGKRQIDDLLVSLGIFEKGIPGVAGVTDTGNAAAAPPPDKNALPPGWVKVEKK